MPRVEDEFQRLVLDFIVKPAIVLLGIFIAGVFVETLFNFPGATKYIFLGVGGIGFFDILLSQENKRTLGYLETHPPTPFP